MSPLLSALSRYARRPHLGSSPRCTGNRKVRRQRPCLEILEDRTVPATISVANASLNEIGSPSSFITSGSGGLSSPQGLTLGPDGNVYVAGNNGAVLRYNGTTGQYINTFVAQGSGGLAFNGNDAGLAFGPDGNLYVASPATNQVLEYNGSTGAFVEAFVTAGSGGLNTPHGITFGPDGNLYVAGNGSNAVLRYQGPLAASPGTPDPATGQSGATFVAQFVPSVSSGGGPDDLIFGPDGKLYVGGGQAFGVQRYDGTTGAFLDTFIPVDDPAHGNLPTGRSMAFDQEGRFYVAFGSVNRYDAQGNFLGDLLVGAVNPGLQQTQGITFDAQGNLLISCANYNMVVRYDRGVVVSLSAASATPVSVNYATADGSATAGNDYFAQSGAVTFAPGQTSRTILLATNEEPVLDGNETFSVQLSNPTGGATIATGTATVTIVDPTRSFAVADTSAIEGDHTAHYRGAFVQGVSILGGFRALTFGPDGNLYTERGPGPAAYAITRYSGTTGAFIDTFVPAGQIAGSAGPVFHGNYLYVAGGTGEVLRYDATTGAFVDDFIPNLSGALTGNNPLAFGPDGNLYITTTSGVVRYDGNTGALLGTFIATGSGGLSGPQALAFDPSRSYVYVVSDGNNQVLKYNAQTGAFVGVTASSGLSDPRDAVFGSDGLLYVLSNGNQRILRYTESGTYVDDYVPAGSGGWTKALSMVFAPNGDLYVAAQSPGGQPSRDEVMDFGTENEAVFTVTNTTASTLPLTVNYATADGTAVAGTNYTAATNGTLTFGPGVTTATIDVPILDSGSQTTSLNFTLTLSNPQAATLSRSQATGTIAPSDQNAKFYVVNDATPTIGGTNTAYKYQPSGTAQAPFGLSLNDLDPRGVAANAAGTTEWVLDANKNVYVYSPGGTLLGSWAAGGLNSSATLTGIATNGTDIWLVDSSADKVYKYNGAASRLSGSQSAASSFNLAGGHNGNTNPQDLVTDGTSFWVVDGSRLKVFKYTLSGSSLGSWGIDPANAHPTGITINPSNVSDIWIVDSGALKVYQYVGAAGRTSGSQNAGATFALAAGDTNPQGIADPPPPDMLLTPTLGPVVLSRPESLVSSAGSLPGLPAGVDGQLAALLSELPALADHLPFASVAGAASATRGDAAAPSADPMPAERNPIDRPAGLALARGQRLDLDPSVPGLLDEIGADRGSHSAAGIDALFALLADGPHADESAG
jgi:sugar lactone lactonase YvrE